MRAETVPLPNDENDFFTHPICNTYEANILGVVRNRITKNVADYKDKHGYLRFPCRCCAENGKKYKNYKNHRFIWECYFGLIKDKLVVDHINNIKSDNMLENLQLLTNQENSKKDAPPGRKLPPIKVRAVNIETGETFIYKSNYGASKDLGINSGSICRVLNGMTNTALSKKYNERYTFQKIDKDSENSTIIIIKNKKNNINHVKKMNLNDN